MLNIFPLCPFLPLFLALTHPSCYSPCPLDTLSSILFMSYTCMCNSIHPYKNLGTNESVILSFQG